MYSETIRLLLYSLGPTTSKLLNLFEFQTYNRLVFKSQNTNYKSNKQIRIGTSLEKIYKNNNNQKPAQFNQK